MALFTDGSVSNILDLTARDSQLLTVASTENIDVTQKMSLAQDEIALALIVLLNQLTYVTQPFWLPPQPDLGSVVVTPALKSWHAYRSLEFVYADAYNNQLNDRYAGKRDQFKDMADSAYEKLIQLGIGIAGRPVAQPGIPNVVSSAPAGGSTPLPDGTYYVTLSWLNQQGQEGASAVPAAVTTSSSTLLIQPGTPPRYAVAWNAYVGATPESMSLQNSSPLNPSQTWLQPGTLTTGGQAPGSGQAADYVQPVPRMIQRG